MTNPIIYGPHLFPYGPEPYIKADGLGISTEKAHENIIQTLVAAFSNKNPGTIQSQLSKRLGFDSNKPVILSFMNWGDMQLVYLTVLSEKLRVATLINQPHMPLGRVKEEFDNLEQLVKIDPRFVVKPLAYFALKEKGHELYASEYVDNARCVAVHNGHGVYDPLPYYHFDKFSPEVSSAVNSSMIALLVNYYDSEKRRGLAKTQISGNDFILTRNFKKDNPNIVQPNMKIIAARGFVEASMDEYVNMIEQEFLLGTNRNGRDVVSGKIKVNHSSKHRMTPLEIERGIEMGLRLRKQHNRQ